VAILLLHYLLRADGSPPTGRWLAFRELPDGMFYAQAFTARAEAVLARGLDEQEDAWRQGLRRKIATLGGQELDMADESYRLLALPLLPVAVLLWRGDAEFPAEARILFDANAGRCLPTEDLAGIGDWLAHHLAARP
jgi:hypothetical protein